MKTSIPKIIEAKDRKWHLIDADGKVLGKLATRIADLLRGKGKVNFTPHMDLGDHVIVINAEKVHVSGSKSDQKIYYTHSQYPGHLKLTPLKKMREEKPHKILEEAVVGMLPKNKLKDHFMKRLHVYKGTEHGHTAQNPQTLTF